MKLIATDLDGTLLNEEHEISPENVKAIEKANASGIEVIVATGRSYESAKKPLNSVGLVCPIISLNGAVIYTETGEITRSVPLQKNVAKLIQHTCEKHDIYFELFTNKGGFSNNRDKFVQVVIDIFTSANPDLDASEVRKHAEQRFQNETISIVENYDTVLAQDDIEVYKVLAFSLDKNNLQSVKEQLQSESELAITSSGYDNLEFNHPDAQKGIALELVANKLGINMKDVMAIGDNFNDVSMLKAAGRGVAMGNADVAIKKMCNYVTTTNKENGVAHAIEAMLNDLQ
ncbi:Cof-type HAD-IIB family hydrolase [Radiobacillus sp. PE A8.2]|uniref:Cof-type HAD-IIB family hydrolase n=1 Tax=Radiobacillus sp. PE A8.2 TaxID=3380349 RepID=UPI00388FC167